MPSGKLPTEQKSLHREIFEQNLQLLHHLEGQNFESIKQEIKKQIDSIPKDDYFVKTQMSKLMPFVEDFENNLSRLDTISRLFDTITVKNYSELRFRLQTKKLQTHKVIQDDDKLQKSIEKVVTDTMRLQRTISNVQKEEKLLDEANEGTFWLELDFAEINAVTNILAPLMIYRSKDIGK